MDDNDRSAYQRQRRREQQPGFAFRQRINTEEGRENGILSFMDVLTVILVLFRF